MNEYRRWTEEDFAKIRAGVAEQLRDPGGSFDERVDDLIKVVADHEFLLSPKEPDRNIANAAKLLSDIAACLKDLEGEEQRKSAACEPFSEIKLVHLNVTFYEGGGDTGDVVWNGALSDALDFLSNDTYWDESRNWAGADTASVSYG